MSTESTNDAGIQRVETCIEISRARLKEGVTLVATYGDKNPVTGRCINYWAIRFHLEVDFDGHQRRDHVSTEEAAVLLAMPTG